MQEVVRKIWIVSITITMLSCLYFLIGTTAFFNRGIDLVTTIIYVVVWLPAVVFIVLSIMLIKKKKIPGKIWTQIPIVVIIVILPFVFGRMLIPAVNVEGWLTKELSKDYVQVTSDDKYEYQLQLINVFQRNAYVQLYLRDKATDKDIIIPVDADIKKIGAVFERMEDEDLEDVLLKRWSFLLPSDTTTGYILTVTENLNGKVETFEINIKTKKAKRIKTNDAVKTSVNDTKKEENT